MFLNLVAYKSLKYIGGHYQLFYAKAILGNFALLNITELGLIGVETTSSEPSLVTSMFGKVVNHFPRNHWKVLRLTTAQKQHWW